MNGIKKSEKSRLRHLEERERRRGWDREALTQIFMGWEGGGREEKAQRDRGAARGVSGTKLSGIISSGYQRDSSWHGQLLPSPSRLLLAGDKRQ